MIRTPLLPLLTPRLLGPRVRWLAAVTCALALPLLNAPLASAADDEEEVEEEVEEGMEEEEGAEEEEVEEEEEAGEGEEMAEEEGETEEGEEETEEGEEGEEGEEDTGDTGNDLAGDMVELDDEDNIVGDTDTDVDPTPGEDTLDELVEDFWHYATIANYRAAVARGEAVMAMEADDATFLQVFEAEARKRRAVLDERLLDWMNVKQLAPVVTKMNERVRAARFKISRDIKFIQSQIERLGQGQRARALATENLSNSGELAVAMMVNYLRDPTHERLHGPIRRAMVELNRLSLNPLLAALDMNDAPNALVVIMGVLGEIGYKDAAPYLMAVATRPNASKPVKQAAINAIKALRVNVGGDAAAADVGDRFYQLAEQMYYDASSIKADTRRPMTPVWYWAGAALRNEQVPVEIFNEVMALRTAERAMRLGTSQDAQSLWLAANIKREAELPSGQEDPTRTEQSPAHFYNVTSGPQYLNAVLARALGDKSSTVAMGAVTSMQEIIGRSNLFTTSAEIGQPLIDAMRFPDRLVRFEAAFAVAAALPTEDFEGSTRVVPLLVEAMRQTGRPAVLIVAGSEGEATRLAAALPGYDTAGAAGVEAALGQARNLPAVDAILVARDVSDPQAEVVLETASRNARLERAAVVVMRPAVAGPLAQRATRERLISVTEANDAGSLGQALEAGRTRAGVLPMDEAAAAQYAERAARLLRDLAVNRNEVLDVSAAEAGLMAALDDPRPVIVQHAAEVLGLLDAPQAQTAMLERVAAEKTADPVRVSLLGGIALSAKSHGNRLDETQVQAIQNLVVNSPTAEVRSAAGEALGALNLPNEQARQLILLQSKDAQLQKPNDAARR